VRVLTMIRVGEYYSRRAGEYDATSWESIDEGEREAVTRLVAALPAGRIVDIGCGTGYLTRLLRGALVALDASSEMLEFARAQVPHATFVQAEVPPLPFADDEFDLAFSSNVYSHIEAVETRDEFVAEGLRVAPTLVILEQAWRPGVARESYEQRRLLDGSEYKVFKRYFIPQELARELHGTIVLASPAFIAVRAARG
jgi:SAM-dependent methyltransferase